MEKTFYSSQDNLQFLYLWLSSAFIMLIEIYVYYKKISCGLNGWWCLLNVSNQNSIIFTFYMLLLNGTSFCRSQIDLKLIYLCALLPLEIWLVMYFTQENTCRVVGYVHASSQCFLYSFLVYCCAIEKHFQKSKTSTSFTYKVPQ